MPTFKFTLLFSASSAPSNPNAPIHRIGGFSESWYQNAADVPTLLSIALNGPVGQQGNGLIPARAALLPAATNIVGYRAQQVLPPAGAQTGVLNYPGVSGSPTGQPQQALLCRAPAVGVPNIKRFSLRSIPAAMVTEGEFAPTQLYNALLQSFFQALGSWFFRARDLTQQSTRIVTITTVAGVTTVTFEGNVAFAVNSFVRILKTLDTGKNLRGGRFQVLSAPTNTTITISNWPFGATTGGSARLDQVTYPQVSAVNVASSRIITRRVGRPFVGYRGRRSKRR